MGKLNSHLLSAVKLLVQEPKRKRRCKKNVDTVTEKIHRDHFCSTVKVDQKANLCKQTETKPAAIKPDRCKLCCIYQLLESENRKDVVSTWWFEAFHFDQNKIQRIAQ